MSCPGPPDVQDRSVSLVRPARFIKQGNVILPGFFSHLEF